MKRYLKQEILSEINNGNEEILVFISRKYFSTVRRLLRVRGIPDELTPVIFSEVLSEVFANLRFRGNEHIDFETYLMNTLNEEIKSLKHGHEVRISEAKGEQEEVIAQCVSILDEQAQQLLCARVAEKLSYERIKERFQFSNAVIAQYEVNKAFDQLEGIVKLRMNIAFN